MPSVLKEAYFTCEQLPAQARQLLQQAESPHRTGASPFALQQAALLALDLQQYFLDPASHAFIPSAPAILPGVARLASAFLARSQPVVFTRHLNCPQDAGAMGFWWRYLIRPDDPRSALAPGLPTEGALILEKSQYDAFYNTRLEELLRQRGVSQVVIAGVMTHLCCETTARAAFVRGFQVFFLVDGTATYNRRFHQASLLNLAHGFAWLVFTDELLACLEGA